MVTFFPEKGELNHRTVRAVRRGKIDEPYIQRADGHGVRFVRGCPVISGPDDGRICRHDEAQDLSRRQAANRMTDAPYSIAATRLAFSLARDSAQAWKSEMKGYSRMSANRTPPPRLRRPRGQPIAISTWATPITLSWQARSTARTG
jgi:hypothetical protein